jgi:hypothetical protein
MIAGRAIAVWALSAAWLMALSWLLGAAPGAALVTRNNVLFQVDVASHSQELTGHPDPFAPDKPRFSAPHPLMPQTWGTIGRLLAAALSTSMPPEAARVLAARLLVAAAAGAGFAAITWIALSSSIPPAWLSCVLILGWASSSTTIVCLPDHFGLSFGLLLVTFAAAWTRAHRDRMRRGPAILAWTAGALAVMTTSTNAVFVGMVVAWMHAREAAAAWASHSGDRRWRTRAVLLVALVAAASALAAAAAARRVVSGETIATRYFHGALFHAPARALAAIPLTLAYPTVAATPHVAAEPGGPVVTLEPWSPGDYSPLGAAGAIAVLTLWAGAVATLLRVPGPGREAAVLLSAWVGFNWAFHSVWGDERFLYTPHWAWVLPVLLILAARRRVPAWYWIAAALAVAAAAASMGGIVWISQRVG